MRLSWRKNSNNETAFLIERCSGTIYECEASQGFVQIGTAPARSSSFLDKSAGGAKRFSYRIRASNRSGGSAYSNPAANVPRPPTDLVAATAGPSLSLSWSWNFQDPAEFVVESCSGNNCTNFVEMARIAENKTRYTPSGLAHGGTYRFRVRSTNAAGSWIAWDKAGTAYSNVVTVTMP